MKAKIARVTKTLEYPILLRNTLFGFRSGERGLGVSIAYFVKGLSRELNIAPSFFYNWYMKISSKEFEKKWLKHGIEGDYYDFLGARLPKNRNFPLGGVFQDTFFFYCLFDDNYDSDLVHKLDQYLNEGSYGYLGKGLNVNVEKEDIVIDAGAWIGDFSALAAAKGARVYAFEPTSLTYSVLLTTVKLNGFNRIIPIKKGLGDVDGYLPMALDPQNSGANSISFSRSSDIEEIEITTIDSFVSSHNLKRVDFIKADIEGAERAMLLGAKETLRTYAPKLAICTYHRSDDPIVLEKLILQANPKYTIIHLNKKLVAQVL